MSPVATALAVAMVVELMSVTSGTVLLCSDPAVSAFVIVYGNDSETWSWDEGNSECSSRFGTELASITSTSLQDAVETLRIKCFGAITKPKKCGSVGIAQAHAATDTIVAQVIGIGRMTAIGVCFT